MGKYDDAVQFGAMAPRLTDDDILEINKAFPSYLFRRRKDREIWSSCCLRHEVLPKEGMTPEMELLMKADHKAEPRGYCHYGATRELRTTAKCPWCGRVGKVKEIGRCGKRDNLTAWRRAVVFKWHGEALWAIACHTDKKYGGNELALISRPEVRPIAAYRFVPGLAERAECRAGWNHWRAYVRFELCHLKTKGTFSEPFGWSSEMGMGYDMVCISEIEHSPLRWCKPELYDEHANSMMRFLALCTVYPRQVEFLMKAGMWRTVKDLVEDGVVNKSAIDWTQEDPRKAFGLDGGEIKKFLANGHQLPVLTAYKRAKKRGVVSPMEDWAWLYKELYYSGLFLELAAKIYNNGLTVAKWRRYIEREHAKRAQKKKETFVTLHTVIIWWKDYINAAKVLGYDLKNPIFLLPKDLSDKHDEATKAAEPIVNAMLSKKNGQKELKRLKTLAKRYTYSDGRYLIRPPIGAKEIVAEGKTLKHCVGGYAQRHVAGRCTILFLRDRLEPGKPLVTIEMRGNQIEQIHGWDDDRTPCKKNPQCIPPRKLYAAFLEPWLAWLEDGSKRDKKGYPVIPGKKKKGVHVA